VFCFVVFQGMPKIVLDNLFVDDLPMFDVTGGVVAQDRACAMTVVGSRARAFNTFSQPLPTPLPIGRHERSD